MFLKAIIATTTLSLASAQSCPPNLVCTYGVNTATCQCNTTPPGGTPINVRPALDTHGGIRSVCVVTNCPIGEYFNLSACRCETKKTIEDPATFLQ